MKDASYCNVHYAKGLISQYRLGKAIIVRPVTWASYFMGTCFCYLTDVSLCFRRY